MIICRFVLTTCRYNDMTTKSGGKRINDVFTGEFAKENIIA